jgi:hypothetical protein
MSTLAEILYNIVAPIFLVAGAGFAMDRLTKLDPASLSRLVVYLFTPCLIFEGTAYAEIGGSEVRDITVIAVFMSLMVAVSAWGAARALKLDQKQESAFVLSATLINAGNYGIPLNRFAFGEAGEFRAVIFFVGTAVITYSLGVFLASRGSVSTRRALLNVFLVPLPYAVMAGLIVNVGDFKLPLPIERAVGLLSDAAIPGMLVVLGVQLSRASVHISRVKPILMASGLRLLAGPAFALILALILGMSGLSRQVTVVQAGMPTAVITGVLAAEFGSDTEFVTGTIVISTVLSIATLSILLWFIM